MDPITHMIIDRPRRLFDEGHKVNRYDQFHKPQAAAEEDLAAVTRLERVWR